MKIARYFLIASLCMHIASFDAVAQKKVTIAGHAIVGLPGMGDTLLTLNSERSWAFKQYDTGPNAALELYSNVGLKNFLITTTGNVGIDVLMPTDKLSVNGNIKAKEQISFGSSEYIRDAGAFVIECNGGLISVADAVDDLGSSTRRWRTVYAANGVINTSDGRAKSNIKKIAYGLNDIMKLQPISFEWKDKPQYGTRLGLVAQEVQKVISEVVVDYEFVKDEETGEESSVPTASLGMYYSDLIPVLIKGMQEQQQVILEKDSRLKALEAEMDMLKARLAKLEQLLSSNASGSSVK